MRALITGGEGFIGSHLAQYLVDRGHQVTSFDNGHDSICRLVEHSGNYRAFKASVNNIDTLARAMSGCDIIYHLAARLDHSRSYRHIIRLTQNNVEGTANIIAMAKKVGIPKIVYASSAAVYGNVVDASEDNPPNPISEYGASKLAAEALLRSAFHNGLEVVILRLFNVWGYKGRDPINKFVTDPAAVLYGDGTQTRDFIHISDVLTALAGAYDWDSSIYNVGSGEEVSLNGLWKLIRDDEPTYQPAPYDEIYRSCANIEYIKKTVGWQPTVLLSELSRVAITQLLSP